MQKSEISWQDPYIDSTSGCLCNRFNIKNEEQLSHIEVAFSSLRIAEIRTTGINQTFDLKHLQAIHKHLFQDVYEWAGELRTVEISKGTTAFLFKDRIEPGADYLFKQMAREKNLHGLDAEQFSQRAGYYLGEVNHLHPFREGNGRTQRIFINHLAACNGYQIAWQNVERTDMIQASIEADRGHPKLMIDIIRANLIDRDYELAIETSKTALGNDINMKFTKPGERYPGQIMSFTQRYVVQLSATDNHQLIVHKKQALTGRFNIHDTVEIHYPCGKSGLVRELSVAKENPTYQQIEKTAEHKHEQYDYER